MRKYLRKSFMIDLEDSLQYPSSGTICNSILKEDHTAEFISREKPISFKLENVVSEVEIDIARGGYVLTCKDVKLSISLIFYLIFIKGLYQNLIIKLTNILRELLEFLFVLVCKFY